MRTDLSAALEAAQIALLRNPYFKVEISRGGEEIPFAGQLFPAPATSEDCPVTFQLSTGRFVLVWSIKEATGTDRWGLWMRVTDTGATSWSDPIRLFTADANYKKYLNPDITELSGGNIGIVYEYRVNSSPTYTVRAIGVDPTGAVVNADHQVLGSGYRQPTVCKNAAGTFYVIARSSTTNYLTKSTSSTFASGSWSAASNIITTSGEKGDPRLTLSKATGGTFLNALVLSWEQVTTTGTNEVRNIYWSVSTDNGSTWGAAAAITSLSAGQDSNRRPSTWIDSSGNAKTVYRQISKYLLYSSTTTPSIASSPRCVHYDSVNNRVFIGTGGSGLCILDLTANTTSYYNTGTTPALPYDIVDLVDYDATGNVVWMVCQNLSGDIFRGIVQLDLDTLTLTRYTYATPGTIQNDLLATTGSAGIETIKWRTDTSKLLVAMTSRTAPSPLCSWFEIDPSDYSFATYGNGQQPGQGITLSDSFLFVVRSNVLYIYAASTNSLVTSVNLATITGDSSAGWVGGPKAVLYDENRSRLYVVQHGVSTDEYACVYELIFDGVNTPTYSGSRWGMNCGAVEFNSFEATKAFYDSSTLTLFISFNQNNIGLDDNPPRAFVHTLNVVSNSLRTWGSTGGEEIIAISDPGNAFYVDSSTNRFFVGGSGYLAIIDLDGSVKGGKLQVGTYSGSWSWATATSFTIDNTLSSLRAFLKTDSRWLIAYTRDYTSGTYRLVWDQELGTTIDITQYVSNGAEVTYYEEDQPGEAELIVASPDGLFDPSNPFSTYKNLLEEGSLLQIWSGDYVSSVAEPILIFYGYITWGGVPGGEVSLERGTPEVFRIKAQDRSKIYRKSRITSTLYSTQSPETIVSLVAQTKLGIASGDIDLPVTGKTLDTVQLVQEYPLEAFALLMQTAGYRPYFNGSGKLVATKLDPTASVDYTYANADCIKGIAIGWTDSGFPNRVTVIGQTIATHGIIYEEEFLSEIQGTAGWWGQDRDLQIWYSSDHVLKCATGTIRLEVVKSLKGGVIKGGNEELTTVEDNYCLIHQTVRNQLPMLLALVGIAMVAGKTFSMGFVVASQILILSQVGEYDYKIYGCPKGEDIPYNVWAQANDLVDIQKKDGQIVEKVIDNPWVSSETFAQDIADFEIERVEWLRKQLISEVSRNLLFEPGDIVQLYNVRYSTTPKMYVTKVIHRIGKRDEAETTLLTGGYIE